MRRLLLTAASVGIALVLALGLATEPVDGQDKKKKKEKITEDTLFDWVNRFSNWGRWGPDDQRGTHNFITPNLSRLAAGLVREGITVGMARRPFKIAFDPTQPLIPEFPSLAPLPTEPIPVDEFALTPFFFWANPPSFTSDRWNVNPASVTISHLDSLCHVALAASTVPRLFPERLHYNGISLAENNTAAGCAKLGIEQFENGIFTRGVLLDATLLKHLREKGREWLAPGTRVTRKDLERLEKIEGVKVRSGDVVLLYTGRWARRDALGPWPPLCFGGAEPPACGIAGFFADTIPFMFEREVAHMGHDAWVDVTPGGFNGFARLVYHGFNAAMGMTHFDNLDLEALAETAKDLGRYEFLFTAAPFPVEGGITSILNPLAVF